MDLSIPTPPPLIPCTQPPTNTYALLLPIPALFHPPTLSLLRSYYASFGRLSTWAPVRAMGRVIVVWMRDEDAAMAKREGDRVEVEVHTEAANGEYFDKARKITLRLLALPPTPLQPPDPSKTHLSAPAATKNYLVSPPGSPPEGWEPVVEEPPNSVSLAEDLRKALEALVVQRRRLGGVADDEDDEIENRAEVILQTEDGFIVQVEDTARHESTEEPSAKGIHLVKATADGMRNGAHDEQLDEEGGGEAGWRTPGLGETTYRILPTARPPV